MSFKRVFKQFSGSTLPRFFGSDKEVDEFSQKYQYDPKEKLGEGQFAKVYKAYGKDDGLEYAVKVVDKRSLSNLDREGLKLEIQVLEEVDHPNIVKLHETFEMKGKIILVLELVKGGELFDRIVAKESYSERDAASVIQKVAAALKYCHERKIVHRDLKPENLLLVSETDDTSVKLADFGFAAFCHDELDDGCGTLVYVAPEILRGRKYRTSPDMWSLGVITYILLCGYPPFFDTDQEALSKKIIKGKYKFRQEDWQNISEDAKDFIRGLLKRDPEARMTAEDVLEHPWISNLAAVPDLPLSTMQKELREFLAKERMRKALGAVIAINRLRNTLNAFAFNDVDGDDDGDDDGEEGEEVREEDI
uniref:non-specific serine/threonine protein kinase n=1 Tax=Aplanochytrium stocchinoi TaxID=215587 RepID=A0A7S3PFJ7_9STRA|mmetsp:Transcript_17888/g.22036  ORF Transcript_17888/g.22036 Transcript_17888/m.22036 type:complete len:363 (-) Transcript_17888:913-2001(-)|eukprot:CAMPEP_0204840812 /NCGR_PEP_ID=MMETSP1346-20131115/39112_1 /ASSEMBLY_ACC=CAM_ASM_000771 /TAXON_ID=215587 /ORGANISM="Aplanochytrium stocchinoi, Strain GSBS06" /LENGTH=362 /DNA_ID=CAMNT_0051978445 /DNA_START=37 /DNA_END=1125 /DNA_ORIENTATION=+